MPLPYNDIPTPPGSRLLAQTREWLRPELAPQMLGKYAVEIGPLVRFRVGPLHMLMVNDPALIDEVVRSEAFNTKGRFYAMVRLVLDNIVSSNGERWATRRKLYITALRGMDVFGATNRACELLEQRWSGRRERSADLEPAIWRLCSDMCMQMAVGECAPESFYADAAVLQGELGGLAPDLAFRPLAVVSPLRWRTLTGVRARLVAWFEERLDRRLAAPDAPRAGRDLLDGLIAAVDDPRAPDDRAAIVAGLMDFFFTSDDVAACALRWAVWLVARHRDDQQHLQEELRQVITPGEPVGPEHLSKLPGLARVARECLRLYPGYGLFGRVTTAPTPLGGYTIPSGVEVLMSPYVLHRSEEHWEEPDRFLPSRWEGVSTHAPGIDPSRPAYMPFGHGHRSCLARHLGWTMVVVGLARIFSSFSLRTQAGHHPKEEFWGTLHSANGLPVQISNAAPAHTFAASA